MHWHGSLCRVPHRASDIIGMLHVYRLDTMNTINGLIFDITGIDPGCDVSTVSGCSWQHAVNHFID